MITKGFGTRQAGTKLKLWIYDLDNIASIELGHLTHFCFYNYKIVCFKCYNCYITYRTDITHVKKVYVTNNRLRV
jgi:hypothetical protein